MNLAFSLLTERCLRFALDLEENKEVVELILNLRVNDLRKQKLLFLQDQNDVANRTPDYCFRAQCNIYLQLYCEKHKTIPTSLSQEISIPSNSPSYRKKIWGGVCAPSLLNVLSTQWVPGRRLWNRTALTFLGRAPQAWP